MVKVGAYCISEESWFAGLFCILVLENNEEREHIACGAPRSVSYEQCREWAKENLDNDYYRVSCPSFIQECQTRVFKVKKLMDSLVWEENEEMNRMLPILGLEVES